MREKSALLCVPASRTPCPFQNDNDDDDDDMAIAAGGNDTLVGRFVQEDTVPWYRKRNLRLLYLLMFPTCIGIEMTSG